MNCIQKFLLRQIGAIRNSVESLPLRRWTQGSAPAARVQTQDQPSRLQGKLTSSHCVFDVAFTALARTATGPLWLLPFLTGTRRPPAAFATVPDICQVWHLLTLVVLLAEALFRRQCDQPPDLFNESASPSQKLNSASLLTGQDEEHRQRQG